MAALVLLETACTDRFDVPIVWEGEHLRVGTDKDIDAWCPGTMPRMDAYTGALKQVMELPDDLVVDFYVLEDPLDEYSLGCAYDDVGCSVDGVAYSRLMPHDHEIVHAARDAAGDSPRAIEEGAATYWGGLLGGNDGSGSGEDVPVGDALAAGQAGDMTLADFERMANFTSYLVHEFGPEPNAALLHETSKATNETEFAEAFERVFGVSLLDAVADYETSWSWCSREAVRSSFFDCAQPPIRVCMGAVDAHPLTKLDFEVSWWLDHAFELDVSCASIEVVGPLRGWLRRDLVIEVPVSGTHSVSAVSEKTDDVSVALKRCDTDCARATPVEVPVSNNGGLATNVDLEPGRYLVRMETKEEHAGPIAIGWACPES